MFSNFVILFLTLFLIFPSEVLASIQISEVSPSSDPEWIKLYNDGDLDIDLSGYLLKDGNSLTSDDLTLSGIITKKSYLTFNHEKGWLNDSGDTVSLYDNATPSASLIAEYKYPTPTPVPTQKPSTPTPTQTPSPTFSPVVTAMSTKKPTQRPTPTKEPEQEMIPEVLSISTSMSSQTPESIEKSVTEESKKYPLLSIIFIISGFGFLGYGGYLLYNIKNANDKQTN